MALNDKKWHVKTYIHKSAMKIALKSNAPKTIRFGYNLRFKKWRLDFALSKSRAGKVKKINN